MGWSVGPLERAALVLRWAIEHVSTGIQLREASMLTRSARGPFEPWEPGALVTPSGYPGMDLWRERRRTTNHVTGYVAMLLPGRCAVVVAHLPGEPVLLLIDDRTCWVQDPQCWNHPNGRTRVELVRL